MPAVPCTTVTDSGRGEGPPPAHRHARCAMDDRYGQRPRWETTPCAPPMVSRICHACRALDDRTGSGRGERPPPAHPLWCREYALHAVSWATVTKSGR
eukprot:2887965-Pyramimonas_sp.AAC.1